MAGSPRMSRQATVVARCRKQGNALSLRAELGIGAGTTEFAPECGIPVASIAKKLGKISCKSAVETR
jgi:hypothetical protein